MFSAERKKKKRRRRNEEREEGGASFSFNVIDKSLDRN